MRFVEVPYKRVPCGKNYVIVVRNREKATREQMENLRDALKVAFGEAQKILILNGDITIGAIPKEQLQLLLERIGDERG